MATAKKSAAKRSPAKNASAKTPATKVASKKRAAKKTAAKKTAEKKTAKKQSPLKASNGRKYAPRASEDVRKEMEEMKRGELTIGRSGKKVTNPKQAIAIGLAKARREGAKVPPNPNTGR